MTQKGLCGVTMAHPNMCIVVVMLVAQLCLTLCDPRTIARQAPLFMSFSWQEYWSGLPFPSPEDLPNQRIEPGPPAFRQILHCLSYKEA